MRNLLALVGAAVIGFAGAGWYLGWYKLGFTKTSDGNVRVETEVNTQKVVQDSSDALKQVGAFIGDKLDKAGQEAKANLPPAPTNTTPTPAPAATPTTEPAKPTTGIWLFGHDLTPTLSK